MAAFEHEGRPCCLFTCVVIGSWARCCGPVRAIACAMGLCLCVHADAIPCVECKGRERRMGGCCEAGGNSHIPFHSPSVRTRHSCAHARPHGDAPRARDSRFVMRSYATAPRPSGFRSAAMVRRPVAFMWARTAPPGPKRTPGPRPMWGVPHAPARRKNPIG